MKKYLKYCLLVWIAVPVWAQQTEVIGPDSHLKVNVDTAAQQELTVYGSWSNFEAVALDWNKIYPNIYYQLFQN